MRSRALAIILAVVVPLAALGVVLTQRDDSSGPPARLPILASGGGGDSTLSAARADAELYPYGVIVYKAGANLPELDGSARAYKVSGADAAAARRLADAFGFDDVEPDADSTFTKDDAQLTVSTSGFWGYTRQASGGVVSSDGVAVACAPDSDCPAPDTTVPQRPANLPSQDEAKGIAIELLQRAGIDIDNASISVDDFVTQWSVRIEPVVDGLPTEGMTTTVTIGEGGVVDYANGIFGRPEAADEYPLIGTRAAIERLNKGGGFTGPRPLAADAQETNAAVSGEPTAVAGSDAGSGRTGAEPGSVAPGEPPPDIVCGDDGGATDPCEPDPDIVCGEGATDPCDPEPPVTGTFPEPPPQEITITGVEQILLFAASYTGEESWLVPAYRFTTDEGVGPSVFAIDDSFLTPPDQIPVDGGFDDPGATVTIEPAPAIEPAKEN